MSHTATVFTPAGTPISDRTVGEIVAANPSQARVFQAFGIDFCCQGGRTLREACTLKGIGLDSVIEQLEAANAAPTDPENNPALLPPVELIQHILDKHHAYLRAELPRIHAMSERVAKVHGGHTPSLIELFEVFCAMAEELDGHMMKEEQILFPAIQTLCAGEGRVMKFLIGMRHSLGAGRQMPERPRRVETAIRDQSFGEPGGVPGCLGDMVCEAWQRLPVAADARCL
jgi:iron-sulfur cluster repair di-iron protein